MRTLSFIPFLFCFLFIGCHKTTPESPETQEVINGMGFLESKSEWTTSSTNVKINISDSIHYFNKVDAVYKAGAPYYKQNLFLIYLSDTIEKKHLHLTVFTPILESDVFFKQKSYDIDSLNIDWTTTTENFVKSGASFKWDSVSYNKNEFSGKASLELQKKLTGHINTDTFYPKQVIYFEF